MKKYLLLICAIIMMTLSTMAQDILFRSSTDSIKVKVLTISSTEVTYRDWSNLDGPIFSIPKDEVAAIHYANGTYNFFSASTSQKTNSDNYKSNRSPMLIRQGNTYIYGDVIMGKSEMSSWLYEHNCKSSASLFSTGLVTANVGWGLLATGLALDLTSVIVFLCKPVENMGASLILSLSGACLEIASVPTLIVGYSKMHRAADIYNMSCRETTKQYWTLQASQNGIGLAYKF